MCVLLLTKVSCAVQVDKEYPYDNLKAEMGGPFGPARWGLEVQTEGGAPAEEAADEEE